MSPRVVEAINRQINSELSASYANLAISAVADPASLLDLDRELGAHTSVPSAKEQA